MIACPTCCIEKPDGFKFCGQCGAHLAGFVAHPEERKVVTALFCDLVSFTALSEAADLEDVDALLRHYDEVARRIIESHGGTVEEFIGDAVVGVFGVPAAHEDDPERAVRAGLRLVESLDGLKRPDGTPLQVRVGVNTGEALVRFDVTPGSGEGFLTGDALAALNDMVGSTWGQADPQATLETAERVITVAERLGVPPDPRAVWCGGCVRCDMGDLGGPSEVRQPLELVRAGGTQECAGDVFWADGLPLAVRCAQAVGDGAVAERLANSIGPLQPLCQHAIAAAQAIVTEARGQYGTAAAGFADAAALWYRFGMPYEEGYALLGHGRCLVALGRAPEAAAPLAAAREILALLEAKPALAEADAMLAPAGTVASWKRDPAVQPARAGVDRATA